MIEDHQHRLTSALQLLSLSQQTYLIALSRAQPEIIISEIRNWRDSETQKQISLAIEEDDQFTEGEEPEKAETVKARDYFQSPGSPNFSLWSVKKPLSRMRPGLLGSFAFQSYEVVESASMHYVPDKARFFQARIHMPWFMQRSWDLSVLRASTGWTFQLNTRNIRPWDAKIFHAVQLGEVENIIELLKNKEASIYDVNPEGMSLLEIALGSEQIESVKALILMGMRTSDLTWEQILSRIWSWSLTEPEASSSLEVASIWKTEMESIREDPWDGSYPFLGFWLIPHLHTILSKPRHVYRLLSSFRWSYIRPEIPLEILSRGLAVASDLPPYLCRPKSDGTCNCDEQNLMRQYFHSLLNHDGNFNDWRCLTRTTFLGLSVPDIVHPHGGKFWNLTSTLQAIWQRRFRLLPFERWIQKAVRLWLEDLSAAGINLEEYMSLEMLFSRHYQTDPMAEISKVKIKPGVRLPEFGPSLVVISAGPRPDDWSFSWDPCVEELLGEFWAAPEDVEKNIPGAWVDERDEDFECLMGDTVLCWVRRSENYRKYNPRPSQVTGEMSKEEYKQRRRLQRQECSEKRYSEGLRVRGMMTCEEFSPYHSRQNGFEPSVSSIRYGKQNTEKQELVLPDAPSTVEIPRAVFLSMRKIMYPG